MPLRRRRTESYEEMRTRIVCETELALLYGLRFPQRVPLIPTIEVGKGTFDRAFAERYWQERVGLEPPPESEA